MKEGMFKYLKGSFVLHEKGRGLSSPNEGSSFFQSIDLASILGGVPVFKRPVSKPRFIIESVKLVAAFSPILPAL